MTQDWIGVEETRRLLGHRSEPRLRRYLNNGLVSSRAVSARFTTGSGKVTRTEKDWLIPAELWPETVHSCPPFLSTDSWKGKLPGYPPERVELVGLRFNRQELGEAFNLNSNDNEEHPAAPPSAVSRAGAKVDSEKWANFSAAFAMLSSEGDFDSQDTINGLYVKVAEWAAEHDLEVPSKNTVSPALSRALRLAKGLSVDDQ